jgi:predicted nucleic acid-binding protein
MEKYILDLIRENNRVIIPNFGAFIISKEPDISILFNNFLSFNDGLLANYVASQKGIDTIVATDQVFDYVDNLKKELEENGVYTIDHLGIFKKDDNGILRFQQADDFDMGIMEDKKEDPDTKIEAEGTDNLTETTLLDIDEASHIEEVPEEEKNDFTDANVDAIVAGNKDSSLLTIDKDEVKEEDEGNAKEDKKEESPAAASSVSVAPPVNTQMDKNPGISKEKVNTAVSSHSHSGTKVVKNSQQKTKKGFVLPVVIVVVVLIGVLAYFLLIFKPKKANEKKIVSIELPAVKKEVVKDSTAALVSKPVNNPVEVKDLSQQVSAVGKNEYHIIVGSFKLEKNAIKMVEKLKKEGFSKSQIIPKGSLFLVSAESDPVYRKIEARQQYVLENNRMESWVYKVK